MKKELSIFIDESGDFGTADVHSPYYLITMVFHDQKDDIAERIDALDNQLANLGLASNYIHAGPIIRKEREYYSISIDSRRKIMARMLQFSRNIKIKYKCFFVEKRQTKNRIDLIGKLSEQISTFIKDNLDYFCNYDDIKIYYDNGQMEVTKILSSVFNSLLSNVEFRLVSPSDYKLFQVADFYCTLELVNLKESRKELSRSEMLFFKSSRILKKNYIKTIRRNTF